jgi:hypothetical protein
MSEDGSADCGEVAEREGLLGGGVASGGDGEVARGAEVRARFQRRSWREERAGAREAGARASQPTSSFLYESQASKTRQEVLRAHGPTHHSPAPVGQPRHGGAEEVHRPALLV